MKYNNSTTIEEYVHMLYDSIDVYRPTQLDPELIGSRLGFSVDYAPIRSFYKDGLIILDERLSEPKQWQCFTHELCHALWHSGNQLMIPPPFRFYQEKQAELFSLHACVPTFMMQELEMPDYESATIELLCKTFCVEPNFAQNRLQQFLKQFTKQRGWCENYSF